jgi:hypothetical protein
MAAAKKGIRATRVRRSADGYHWLAEAKDHRGFWMSQGTYAKKVDAQRANLRARQRGYA